MAMCRDVPRKKYMSTGKNETYNPYTGGRLVSSPYAIPIWGDRGGCKVIVKQGVDVGERAPEYNNVTHSK